MIGNEDYSPGRYTTTFLAGMTETSFTIAISNDNVYEGNETFDVDIIRSHLPDHVTLGNIHRATLTIVDFGKLLLYEKYYVLNYIARS